MMDELKIIAENSKRTHYKHDRFTLIYIIEEYKAKVKILMRNKNFN